MALLYLETNYLLGTATGRLPPVEQFVDLARPARVAIPAICFMEALSAVMREVSRANEFQQQLQKRVGEIQDSELMTEAKQLRQNLEAAIISGGRTINLVQLQLNDTMDRLTREARMISLSAAAIQNATGTQLCKQPTDNMILHILLEDAATEPDPVKALFTENIDDFLSEGGGERLRLAGVHKLFGEFDSLARWLKSAGG